MQLEKAKETKQDMERCRLLAQRIAEELAPATAAVLNAETPALEKALHRAGVDANPFTVAARQADLLVVEDPAWVEMPAQMPGQVLLVFTGSNVAEGWAEELARRGYYRDFRWRSRGRAQQSALYCTVQPATAEMIAGYEKELDLLRDRMVRAERTCNEEAALIERLRSDLSLSRSHAKNLEKTLNEVTSSTFWKLTWPMRYVVSKSRQIWHTFPLFVLLGELRRDGISGVREHARARREYAALFPGNLLRADRFAPVELLVRQANDQPAGPKISIVVPLYNTPLDFLDEMLDSVVNQTYKNWELCCVDAGKDEAVGQHVQARAKADARIRYQKLEKNELIPGNTNKGFEMATGEYIALLDHDDLLHPCALWYAARAIAEQKADFVYTDEATFEGKPEHVVLYHFKLGAQIVGGEGVDKRIDVLATAIRAKMKALELTELDLSYAPPYSSAKDPVNMAGFMIEDLESGKVQQFHWNDVEDLPCDGSATLLDVRTEGEYRRGHLNGFRNIPLDDLREHLDELERDKPIYVNCQTGLRSYLACRLLTQYGFG